MAHNAPTLDIERTQAGRICHLRGDWVLQKLLEPDCEILHVLAHWQEQPSDQWDLTDLGRMDSAGALAVWRAWGEQRPTNLKDPNARGHWFARLERMQLESPSQIAVFEQTRHLLPKVGMGIHGFATQLYEMVLSTGQIFVDLWHCVQNPRLFPVKEFSATVYRSGAQSVGLLAFLGILVGMVLTYQIEGQLQQFGMSQSVITAVGLAFLRELGPFIAALVMVGRTGSATTAGIGAMHITEELDALRAFGVSPSLRVVLPRVLGMTIAMPLLVLWTDFWGVLGGVYLSNSQMGVTWQMWLAWFPSAVPVQNYIIGLGKGLLFGFMIGLTSSYYGMVSPPDTQGLTRNITRAVVVGLSLVLVIESGFGFMFSGVGL